MFIYSPFPPRRVSIETADSALCVSEESSPSMDMGGAPGPSSLDLRAEAGIVTSRDAPLAVDDVAGWGESRKILRFSGDDEALNGNSAGPACFPAEAFTLGFPSPSDLASPCGEGGEELSAAEKCGPGPGSWVTGAASAWWRTTSRRRYPRPRFWPGPADAPPLPRRAQALRPAVQQDPDRRRFGHPVSLTIGEVQCTEIGVSRVPTPQPQRCGRWPRPPDLAFSRAPLDRGRPSQFQLRTRQAAHRCARWHAPRPE